jgi:hypothetical protein
MSYTSNTVLHLPFDGSLLDRVSGVNMTPTDGKTPEYVTSKFDRAWQLRDDVSASIDAMNGLSTAFTIGFWLRPSYPGMVTNPTTGLTESLKMPVMSKAVFSYNSTTGETTATFNKFIVWEETQDTGRNRLRVTVNGLTSATATSNSYTPDTYHYFWIVYSGSGQFIRIYVDMTNSSSTTTGTVPSSLATSTANFMINGGLVGSRYNTVKNTGILEDVVVFNSENTSVSDMYRALNLGAIYVADSTYALYDEVDQGVVFEDSSTVQINAIYGNRGNVYVGRSDGKLLKGTRTLWESRRDFSNGGEVDSLSIITRSTTDNLLIQDGALNVTNAIVRV